MAPNHPNADRFYPPEKRAVAERYGGYLGGREVQGRLGMARTQLNGDMNGQFLKSFCIFLRKSRLVRSIQRKPWVCPPIQLRIIKRCISVFVTNNYLAGVGHPPRLGKHPRQKTYGLWCSAAIFRFLSQDDKWSREEMPRKMLMISHTANED